MSARGYARGFRELVVYRESAQVAADLFELSQRFPREETDSLTGQGRRAARAIGAQIAEAWGRRRHIRRFVSKLADADAEQLETQHCVDVAVSCGYLPPAEAARLKERLSAIGRMLNTMILKAEQFCHDDERLVREIPTEYFVGQRDRPTSIGLSDRSPVTGYGSRQCRSL